MMRGCAAGAGSALILTEAKGRTRGRAQSQGVSCYGGAKPPPHIERLSRIQHCLRLLGQSRLRAKGLRPKTEGQTPCF